MTNVSPEAQLAAFLAKYKPEIAELARAIRAKMQARLPGAIEIIYDNYNALVIGYGPSERASEAIFSIALYPRWINLFFLHGASLPDPKKVLQGSGKVVRSVKITDAGDLDKPAIRALMDRAVKAAPVRLDPAAPFRVVVRSVSAKQRARRPASEKSVGQG